MMVQYVADVRHAVYENTGGNCMVTVVPFVAMLKRQRLDGTTQIAAQKQLWAAWGDDYFCVYPQDPNASDDGYDNETYCKSIQEARQDWVARQNEDKVDEVGFDFGEYSMLAVSVWRLHVLYESNDGMLGEAAQSLFQ